MTPMKLSRQQQAIYDLLVTAGERGVTNYELNKKICFRFSARIWELNQRGFVIKSTRVKGSEWRSTLVRVPPVEAPKPDPAPAPAKPQEELFEMVRYGDMVMYR